MANPWKFYVYEIYNQDHCLYIGKGSGARLRAQIKSFGASGKEIARFKSEKDAYKFERFFISERQPYLNRHAGGNGNTSTKKRKFPVTKEEKLIKQIGLRRYVARMLLKFDLTGYIDQSNLDNIRAVANGPWC